MSNLLGGNLDYWFKKDLCFLTSAHNAINSTNLCILCIPCILICLIMLFYSSKYIFTSFQISGLFKIIVLNFQMFGKFPYIFLLLISIFIPLWPEKILFMNSVFQIQFCTIIETFLVFCQIFCGHWMSLVEIKPVRGYVCVCVWSCSVMSDSLRPRGL